MPKPLPKKARVVIVGGGVVGCSIAYHLTKYGCEDVVLLERRNLTCGTTWHAAGLLTGLRRNENATKLAKYSMDLYRSLEEETGQATGILTVGTIQIASDPERYEEMRRGCDLARRFGMETREITPGEIKEMFPLAHVDDIIAGFHFPEDGRTNPTDTTMALAKGARMRGAQIFEGVTVDDVIIRGGRVVGVETDQGDIECDAIVNCSGMWARELGAKSGVNIPLQAAEHYYLITEAIDGMTPDLPVLRDPGSSSYYREETGKLMIGYFEPKGAVWGQDGIPKDFCFDEIPADWDRMLPVIEKSMKRIPISENSGIKLFFCGPESFTPDNNYIMGEAPTVEKYFVAAGFNSLGIVSAGGAGMVMAKWIMERHAPMDVVDVDIRRVSGFESNKAFLKDRIGEALATSYLHHWPFRQWETARGVKKLVLHDRLAKVGACFGEMAGWERPNWYAPEDVEPTYEYSYKRQNWFRHNAEEHKAVREAVGLFEQSSFSKFLVQGRDAEKVLNYIATNDVAVPVGKAVYTQFLNERGTIEADLTITRVADDAFWVITGAVTHTHVFHWIKSHIPTDVHCMIADISGAYGMLNIQGPSARALLSRLTDTSLSSDAFAFGTMQDIEIGYQSVKAQRLTFMGELGWELYIPTEYLQQVYDAIVEVGSDHGLRHCGYHALQTLRMEKAYREWGHDIGSDETPFEAGLGFASKIDKPGGFIGRDAVAREKEKNAKTKRLVHFLLKDPEPLLYHNEPILLNGEMNGHTLSAMYGHTLGGSVALGYLHNQEGITPAWLDEQNVEIVVAGKSVPAQASLRPMYDPKSERVKS